MALAECVLAEPGVSAGSDRDVGDEVNGLVERASPHLTSEECRQLQTAMAARKHLFAKGKGDLGRTDIVQHQIHTGDQPAIKQRVRRYPAARREEERQLVEDMLAIGIIQESNSAWSSPTVLVKKKDGTTVLHRLPATQPSHEGRRLPSPSHRGQPEHAWWRKVFL